MGGGLRLVAGSPAPRAAGRPLRADRAAAALARGRDGASADGAAAPGLPGAGPRLDRAPPARLWSRKGAAGRPPRPAANCAAAAARLGVGRGEAGRKGVADGLGHGCGEVGKTRGLEPLAAAAGPLAALPPPPLFCSADGGGGSPAALAYGSRGTDGVSVLQTTGWTYNLVGARRVARRARRVRGVRPRRVRSRSCRAARRRQRQAGGRAAGGAPRRRRRRAAVGEVAGARPGAAGALGSGQSGARARRRRGARGACDPARLGASTCSDLNTTFKTCDRSGNWPLAPRAAAAPWLVTGSGDIFCYRKSL